MSLFRTMRHKMTMTLIVANLVVLVVVFFPRLAPSIMRWVTVGVLGANVLYLLWAGRRV